MLMRVAAIVFFFLIRLQFPKSKLTSDILHRRYGHSTLKRTGKFEKLDCRLRKAELDLEILLWYRDNNVIPNFFNFCISQSLKASSTMAMSIKLITGMSIKAITGRDSS